MNRSSLHIILVGLFISLASIFGFLSAILSINIYVTAAIAFAAGIWLYRYISRKASPDLTNDISKTAFIVLSAGILLISGFSCMLVREHGAIDSVGNWNFAAKYIADSKHWKQLLAYSPIHSHPDYPMGYSGATAFYWRLFHTQNEIIPLALTLFATITIPVLVYLELYKKHLGIAITTLILFVFNPFYLNCGLNQYADTLLSLYILSAFITMNHYKASNNKIYLLVCTASLGAAAWVKNEGIFTTVIFGLAYLRTFVSKETIKHAILGIIPFVFVLGLFRLGYKPANDLVAYNGAGYDGHNTMMGRIADKSRYKLIVEHLFNALSGYFIGLKLLGAVYVVYNIFAQKNLSRNFYIICIILAAYFGAYLTTPRELEWHLATSFQRLLLQLYPSFLLIIGLELSKIKVPTLNTDNK